MKSIWATTSTSTRPRRRRIPGSVGSIDDNPLDVEDNDPGDTGGTDDDTRDDWQVVDTMAEVSITVLCTVEFMACIAACLIPG